MRSGSGTTEVAVATSDFGVTVSAASGGGGVIGIDAEGEEGFRSGRGRGSAAVTVGFRSGTGIAPVTVAGSDAIAGAKEGEACCAA